MGGVLFCVRKLEFPIVAGVFDEGLNGFNMSA